MSSTIIELKVYHHISSNTTGERMITLHSKHVFQLSKAHETVKPKWQTYYKLVCEKSIRKISVTGQENVFVEAEYVM